MTVYSGPLLRKYPLAMWYETWAKDDYHGDMSLI